MKHVLIKEAVCVSLLGMLILLSPAICVSAQNAGSKSSTPHARATLADFAWLSGHWTGTIGKTTVEEFCSLPSHGLMMCMFRAAAKQTTGLEFISIEETPTGVVEQVRFFEPGLKPDNPPSATLELTNYTHTMFVFENKSGIPKRVTMTRNGPSAMDSHIEIIDANGKTSFRDVHWVRAR